MASHDNKVSPGSASRELINLGDLRRQRFLDENVFTSIEDLLGKGEVTCSRGGDDHAMDVRIFQNDLMIFDCAAERKICLHKRAAFCARIHHVLDRAPGSAEKLRSRFGPQ